MRVAGGLAMLMLRRCFCHNPKYIVSRYKTDIAFAGPVGPHAVDCIERAGPLAAVRLAMLAASNSEGAALEIAKQAVLCARSFLKVLS